MYLLDACLHPRLGALPENERRAALRRASRTPFDVIELIGIALGLVIVTALTRYGAVEWSLLERLAAWAANVVVAVPLVFIFIAPFLVRRIRRGLDSELGRRGKP